VPNETNGQRDHPFVLRRARPLFILVAAGTPVLSPCAEAQSSPPPAFRERQISLTLGVDFERQRLDGTERVTLENWTDRPAATVYFLLNRLMTVRAVHDGGRSARFTQNVVRFDDDSLRQVVQVTVRFARSVPPLGRVTLDVAFGGNLVGYTETGSLYIQDRVDTAFTILRADAYAFPVVGVANDGANRRRPTVDFSYDLDIGVPDGFVVAAAGTLVARDASNGRTRWRYHNGQLSPFINICIARYHVLTNGGLRISFFPADSMGAARVATSVARAMRDLTVWFGPLGSDPNVTISEIPDGWGSQASLTGGIIQEAGAFREPGQLRALYHELSHLWNAPDNDRPSPRFCSSCSPNVWTRTRRARRHSRGPSSECETRLPPTRDSDKWHQRRTDASG
jgi:hypothetical protein